MKTKKHLLALCLALTAFFVKSQDKYEFMVIIYSPHYSEMTISIDGKEFIKEDIKLEKSERSYRNANPILQKIKDYQEQNWELTTLINSPVGLSGNINEEFFAYLRKKKK